MHTQNHEQPGPCYHSNPFFESQSLKFANRCVHYSLMMNLLTLLVVQFKVTVFITAGDGVRHAVSIGVLGVHDSYQCLRAGILRKKGFIAEERR